MKQTGGQKSDTGTRREQQLMTAIGKNAAIIDAYCIGIEKHAGQMMELVGELKTHTKNRIAAHKAHLTMAKKRLPVYKLKGV